MSEVRFQLVMRTEILRNDNTSWDEEEVLSVFKECITWQDEEELYNVEADNEGWHLTKVEDKVYIDYLLYTTDDVEGIHHELVLEALPTQEMFESKFGMITNLLDIKQPKFLMISFSTGGCAGYVEID